MISAKTTAKSQKIQRIQLARKKWKKKRALTQPTTTPTKLMNPKRSQRRTQRVMVKLATRMRRIHLKPPEIEE